MCVRVVCGCVCTSMDKCVCAVVSVYVNNETETILYLLSLRNNKGKLII